MRIDVSGRITGRNCRVLDIGRDSAACPAEVEDKGESCHVHPQFKEGHGTHTQNSTPVHTPVHTGAAVQTPIFTTKHTCSPVHTTAD